MIISKGIKKEVQTEIKRNKNWCWSDLCRTIDDDPWGIPFRLVIKWDKVIVETSFVALEKDTRRNLTFFS